MGKITKWTNEQRIEADIWADLSVSGTSLDDLRRASEDPEGEAAELCRVATEQGYNVSETVEVYVSELAYLWERGERAPDTGSVIRLAELGEYLTEHTDPEDLRAIIARAHEADL